MKEIRIEKLTLNVGAGKNVDMLKKGKKLLKNITGIDPVSTVTQKRIPTWGLRPGLPVGCKITLRGKDADELIKRLLDAKANMLREDDFDEAGNVSFGIPEYIDIKGVEYDPEIGVIGLQVCITLERPGFRVKKKNISRSKIGNSHIIKKEDALSFMKSRFNIKVGDEQ